jgi:hypothetical protein
LPHAPQLSASFSGSTQAPLHSSSDSGHTQFPKKHSRSLPQLLPQRPQLRELVPSDTH